MNGKVVTNDYNLNKVAQFQGVEVLNINELANAVKPVAIPGEEMVAQVVKEGKESNQWVGADPLVTPRSTQRSGTAWKRKKERI